MKSLKGAKGSNVILAMGITVIFIAAFFILLTFDRLVGINIACILHTAGLCTKDMFTISTYGLFIIFTMFVMIASAAYVMFTSINLEKRYKYRKQLKKMPGGK